MLTTPPLAPKTLAALKELGIRTREDLQKIGAVRAFLLLKASGLTVTKSTLWQLDALVSGMDVRHISEERKTELGEALKTIRLLLFSLLKMRWKPLCGWR